MNRFVPALLFALAMLASSCSGGGPAAVVNGVEITEVEVNGIIQADGEDLSEERFRSVLTALVQWSAVAEAAREQYGIDPTDAEITAYEEQILTAQGALANRDAFLQAQGVTDAGFRVTANRLLVEESVVAELQGDIEVPTSEEAEQLLADNPASWTVVCAADIVVATGEQADAARARLDAGEDFAQVSAEVSVAPNAATEGGSLGCTLPVDWIPALADAAMTGEVGEVIGPIEADLRFHLLRIDSRTEATAEVIQASIVRTESQAMLEAWVLDAVNSADIRIDEQYGSWTTDPIPSIVAPAS